MSAPAPAAPAFAELVAASNFSFLRGASHPEELATIARALGLAALAVTDRNTVAGSVRAHVAAKAAGLRSLPGARLVFCDGTPDVAVWPSDRAAWGRLCRLLTAGNMRGEKGDCRLLRSDLLAWGEGLLMALLPAPGAIGTRGVLNQLADAFPGNVWLAARMGHDGADRRRLAESLALAQDCRAGLLATGDVLYHAPSRRRLQDILTCIREHTSLREAGRALAPNAERHLKTPAEMARLFRDAPQALAASIEIVSRARFSLDELAYEYPDEPVEGYASPQEALVSLTKQGAATRYPAGVPARVEAQIAHELAIVAELGYAPYFLTVYDIVRFARSRGILAQGRGSAANSAVCFCLAITEVDPDRADLLFERFISPERREPPDIDVDFEHERREEVIQYIYERYGRERAGLAATVITYRARSAIREVGKAFGLSQDTVSGLSGTVWGWSSSAVSADDFRRRGLDPSAGDSAQVIAHARDIISFPRHLSQHVGGFVITRGRLDEVVPITRAAMQDRTMVEWDKDDLDALGILKIDILALGMLSCIRKALDLIAAHYGEELTIATIPAEETSIYDMLCRADSLGVFQVESRAQMTMLPRLKPRCFYDLVVEVAIVRPGPIQGDMVHPYLRRRQGREKVEYPSADLEQVLGKTLGVPLFQEQAMRIAIVAAGFTPGEADRLRRAMATFRRVGTIHTFQRKMVEGMAARGYDRDFAERCFRQIEGFGEYGFPESHAASFALLVYASAWLKCRYPDVFAASLINAQPMGFYAPAQIVRDAREHGVEIREADINHSDWDCTLEPGTPGESVGSRLAPAHASMKDVIRSTHAVRLGLRLVKGFSQADAERLVAARAGGAFDSLRDLWLRSGLGPSAIERLADADAFRSVGLDRRGALWAARALASDAAGLPLFDHVAGAGRRDEPDANLPPMPVGEHVVNDYRFTGLSLKTHPCALLRKSLQDGGAAPAQILSRTPNGRRVRVAGLVLVRQRPGSAKGVIFMTLEDESGVANVVVWPKVFERFRPVVIGARLIAVSGRVQAESGVIHVVADRLDDLTPLLASLSELGAGLDSLARADEVRKPVEDIRAKRQRHGRLARLIADAPELQTDLDRFTETARKAMPKGRNFH